MNSFSSFGALPTIQTRKALLLLDLQNDFVRPSGALYVPNTADFLDTLPQLVSAFRSTGDIVWVRSHYESRQELIDSNDQEVIVLGRGGDDKAEISGPVDEEAFLSTDSPRCGRPQTPGTQFPAPLLAAINADSDTLMVKSEYSALRNQSLILSFRSRFVTEIYLCGSLSNISVYATVLDAVSLGFSVTLIEDCLGFRDFNRHEEAMRRMADIFGANGITTEELGQEIDWQETDAIACKGGSRPVRAVTPAGIEGVLDDLDVRTSPDSTIKERLLERFALDEDEDALGLATFARARDRYRPPPTTGNPPQGQDASTEKKHRTKVRRPKRPDQKPEASSDNRRSRRSKPSQDLRGPGDKIGEGDSRIIHDLDLPSGAFEKIRDEVAWQKMFHLSGQVPRLVAVQGRAQSDGSIPIYRHPADESPPLHPFTLTVDRVRIIVERILGHPINHVLIQLYRDGQDRISEHSDKTLDIARSSSICNVSLGAQRVMVLRTKASTKASQETEEAESGRQSQRIPMPHESLFVLGEKTNMRWLHGIRPDKRPDSTKTVEERAYGGERISLTFRHISTFLSPAGDTIWGQGAISKRQDQARSAIHGDAAETERLIRAFGQENYATEFDWDGVYGGGFDVVNFVTASAAQLIVGDDPVANLRARLCLSENSMRYDVAPTDENDDKRPVYIGTDGTRVAGDVEIMNHLAQRTSETERPGIERLQGGTLLPRIEELLTSWREQRNRSSDDERTALQTWEKALDGQHYLGGSVFSIDDCSLWPVLREIVQERGYFSATQFPNLHQYYRRVEKRGLVKATLEEM